MPFQDPQEQVKDLKRESFLATKDILTDERAVVAYGNTKSIDSYQEVLLPSGWVFDRFEKNPVMPWSHNYRIPPVGRVMWWKTDDVGLLFKGQFANTLFADEVWQLYAGKFLTSFSVGYEQLESVRPADEEAYMKLIEEHNIPGRPRLIGTKQSLWEISPVVLPANADSLVTGIEERKLKSKALIDMVQQLCQDDEFCKQVGHTKDLLIRIVETRKPAEKVQVQGADFAKDEEARQEPKTSIEEAMKTLSNQLKELKDVITVFQTRIMDVEAGRKPEAPGTEDTSANEPESSVGDLVAYIDRRLPEIVNGELRRLRGEITKA